MILRLEEALSVSFVPISHLQDRHRDENQKLQTLTRLRAQEDLKLQPSGDA